MNIDSLATQGTNYRVSLDLQDKGGETVDTDDWVIRFKRVVTGGSDGIGSNTSFAMTNTDYTTLPTSTSGGGQRVMGFKDSDGDGGAIARSDYNMFPAPDEWSPETHIDFTAVPITQYFEIIRSGLTGTGTLTCNVYTASDYSGTPATGAKSADSMVVRYFSIGNYSDSVNTGGLEAKITDFNFYNGWDGAGSVPTPTYTATFESGEWGENNANFIGVSATYTDEKTTITDVPAGTRYEETDTRKIFRKGEKTTEGDNTSGSTQTDNSGRVQSGKITGLPAGEIIKSVQVNCSVTASRNWRVAYYSDTSGVPNALMEDIGEVGALTTGFNTTNANGTQVVPSDGIVWVGVQVSASGASLVARSSPHNTGGYQVAHTYGSMPSPFGSGGVDKGINVKITTTAWVEKGTA